MEAINKAGSAVGIRVKDGNMISQGKWKSIVCPGIVLAAEKRLDSKLLDIRKRTEKMYKVDDHCAYVLV
jgi:20S proteasome subunit alpha 3